MNRQRLDDIEHSVASGQLDLDQATDVIRELLRGVRWRVPLKAVVRIGYEEHIGDAWRVIDSMLKRRGIDVADSGVNFDEYGPVQDELMELIDEKRQCSS
jgi:hypothetical protein